VTPLDEAREAVDETDLDDLVVTAFCICSDIHCVCEERYAERLQPAQCVAFVWQWRSGLAMAEA